MVRPLRTRRGGVVTPTHHKTKYYFIPPCLFSRRQPARVLATAQRASPPCPTARRASSTPLLTAAEEAKLRGLVSQLASLEEAGRAAQLRSWLAYPINRGLAQSNATTGWKCMWRYGIAQCAVLYLPRGDPMPAKLTGAAQEWAVRAVERTTGLTVRQEALNPSAVDRSNVLLRVQPACRQYDLISRTCGTPLDLPSNSTEPLVHAVWLRNGVVVRGVVGSDPRGVWLDEHTLLALYSHWATLWRDGQLASQLPKHALVVMVAQNLSDPHSAAVPLWLDGLKQAAWEKNWAPFRYGERVLLSYQLAPRHMVLACEWSNGRCTLAHNASSQGVFDARKDSAVLGARIRPRLTSPAVLVRGVNVGVGHYRLVDSTYLHFFFSFASEPPFEVLQASQTFRLRSRARDSVRDGVQFVSGVYLQGETEQLVMTYGVGDRVAYQTSLRVDEVFRMLTDRGDGSERYRYCAAAHDSGRHSIYSCDDSMCEGDGGPVLALCQGRCGRWPWNCDLVSEWSGTISDRLLARALKTSSRGDSISQVAFTQARQRHTGSTLNWTQSRVEWASQMLEEFT